MGIKYEVTGMKLGHRLHFTGLGWSWDKTSALTFDSLHDADVCADTLGEEEVHAITVHVRVS